MINVKIIKYTLAIIILSTSGLLAQKGKDANNLIQFSGVTVTEDEYGEMAPLPYTTISVLGTSRGTYAEIDGFFSIVAAIGDTMQFSRIVWPFARMVNF